MIEVKNVGMRFKMSQNRVNSLKETIVTFYKRKGNVKEFWALKNISFSVNKGEVIGIIGENGSGKSTLLKIISGIMKPTVGEVNVYGNIVPMLELGSGFDFELTGEENIYLNGAILGYTKEYVESKKQSIIDFSELGNFIYEPIRNYSSGMLMRLAFSIATEVKPEIMIVDEILSVGDSKFQNKSSKKMLELMGGGTTVLFVSHSIDQIEKMCDKVLWLDHGKIKMFGDTKLVCETYRNFLF